MSGRFWRAMCFVARAGPLEAATLLTVGVCAGAVAVPAAWLMKVLVDGLTAHSLDRNQVLAVAAGAVLLGVASTLLVYVSAVAGVSLEAKTKLRVEMRLARAASRHCGTQFLEAPDRHDELHLARRSSDLMASTVPPAVVEVASAVAIFVGYGAVLWASWPWVVIALIVVAVPSGLLQRRVDRSAADLVQQSSSEYRWHDYYSRLFFDPPSARDVRLHGAHSLFLSRLEDSLRSALRREVVAQVRVTWSRAAIGLVQGLLVATGTGFVAMGVYSGNISVGELVLFVTAVTSVQARIASLLGLGAGISLTLASFSCLEHFANEVSPPEPPSSQRGPDITAEEVPRVRAGITFSNVWFRYAPNSPWVLRGMSFTLPAGKVTGLVGLNGSGKSTIIRLLLRYLEPERGEITWDGVDIRTFPPESYRRRITGVLQDRIQYEMSLGDNVWLGDLDRLGDLGALSDALLEVGLDEVVAAKRLNASSMLSPTRRDESGWSGTTLSGGEWERVALARVAITQGIELEILDEPNAGLDAVAERLLRQRIHSHADRRTRLVVSHRSGTLNQADQILVVSKGQIAESGTHIQLSVSNGLYSSLLGAQAMTVPPSPADLLP